MVDFGYRVSATTGFRHMVYRCLNRLNRIEASSIFIRKVKLGLFFSVLFIGKQLVFATVPNTFWSEPGQTDFKVKIDDIRFPSNRAGAQVEIFYGTLEPVPNTLNYNYQIDDPWGTAELIILTETNLPRSDINRDYLKINENLDVQITISPATLAGYTVPHRWLYAGQIRGRLPGINRNTRYILGSQGQMILKLRRDIVGGSVLLPQDTLLTDIFLSMLGSYNPGPSRILPKNPLPASRIWLVRQALPPPVECSIQANRREVGFGNLNSANITVDGSRYGQEIQLTYNCNSQRNLPVKIDMFAANTGFSRDYIATSNPNLGIVMKHGGETVKPQNSFNSMLINGTGSDRIYVAPVKNPTAKTIATGDFTANAILVLSLQ